MPNIKIIADNYKIKEIFDLPDLPSRIEVYDNSSGLLPAGTVNGAIRRITINSPGNYYYTPDVTPNSAGVGAVIVPNITNWTQTANAQTAIIFK